MARMIKVIHNDQPADALELDVVEAKEPWSEFTLEDGTRLRVRVNLISIARVQGAYDADGQPVYQVNLSPAMGVTNVPENLKKGAN